MNGIISPITGRLSHPKMLLNIAIMPTKPTLIKIIIIRDADGSATPSDTSGRIVLLVMISP